MLKCGTHGLFTLKGHLIFIFAYPFVVPGSTTGQQGLAATTSERPGQKRTQVYPGPEVIWLARKALEAGKSLSAKLPAVGCPTRYLHVGVNEQENEI